MGPCSDANFGSVGIRFAPPYGAKVALETGFPVDGGNDSNALGLLMVLLPDPRGAAQQPDSGEAYFEPSLARTASGGFIPAKALMTTLTARNVTLIHMPGGPRALINLAHSTTIFIVSQFERRGERPLNGKVRFRTRGSVLGVTTLFLFLVVPSMTRITMM